MVTGNKTKEGQGTVGERPQPSQTSAGVQDPVAGLGIGRDTVAAASWG